MAKRDLARSNRRSAATSRAPRRPRRFSLVGGGAGGAAAEAEASAARSQPLSDPERERIAAALTFARAPATRRAYSSAWRGWVRWAEARGFPLLPADSEHVAAYLAARADDGVSVATLGVIRAAVRAIHADHGVADPTRDGVAAAMLAGLRRELGRPPRQAVGLTGAGLEAIVATAPDTLAGRLDVAMCRTMRDAMLRRSEAAALTWGDIERAADGSGRLLIRRSKTDQGGAGTLQYLAPETMASLDAIRPESAGRERFVFALRGDGGRPPHPASLSERIRAAALRAGLGPGYSGHSPRIGMTRDLAVIGVELPALMVAGRWQSPTMPAHYARGEDAERGAVARYYRAMREGFAPAS